MSNGYRLLYDGGIQVRCYPVMDALIGVGGHFIHLSETYDNLKEVLTTVHDRKDVSNDCGFLANLPMIIDTRTLGSLTIDAKGMCRDTVESGISTHAYIEGLARLLGVYRYLKSRDIEDAFRHRSVDLLRSGVYTQGTMNDIYDEINSSIPDMLLTTDIIPVTTRGDRLKFESKIRFNISRDGGYGYLSI